MSDVSNRRSEPHVLELDDYEAANLMAAMVFLGKVGGDTGDWYAQIIHKLVALDVQTAPNKTAHEQQRELALRTGWHQLWSSG